MPAVAMLHEEDPREVILKQVGDLEGVHIYGGDMLVATYKRPEKTKSGIILTDKHREEDKHQGKVGLVVKMGPTCYIDADGNKFRDINVGDWVVFHPSDGWRVTLNTLKHAISSEDTVDCRVIGEQFIRMSVDHPDLIY